MNEEESRALIAELQEVRAALRAQTSLLRLVIKQLDAWNAAYRAGERVPVPSLPLDDV